MSYPKDASVSERVTAEAIKYHQNAARLDDSERLDVPAIVRRVAGPTPPRRAELSPIVLLGFSWLMVIVTWVLAWAVHAGMFR